MIFAGPLLNLTRAQVRYGNQFEALNMPRHPYRYFLSFRKLIAFNTVYYVYADKLPLRMPLQGALSLLISAFKSPSCQWRSAGSSALHRLCAAGLERPFRRPAPTTILTTFPLFRAHTRELSCPVVHGYSSHP